MLSLSSAAKRGSAIDGSSPSPSPTPNRRRCVSRYARTRSPSSLSTSRPVASAGAGPFVCPVSDAPRRSTVQSPGGASQCSTPSRTWSVRSTTVIGSTDPTSTLRVGRHGEVVGDDAEAGLGLCAMDAPTRAQGELRDLEGVGRAEHGRPAHAVGERRQRVGRARSRQHQAEPPRGDGGKARGPGRDGVRRQLRDIPVLDAVVARLQHRGCRRRGAEAARARQPDHDRAHRDGIVRTPARSRPSTSRRGPAAARACGRTNRRSGTTTRRSAPTRGRGRASAPRATGRRGTRARASPWPSRRRRARHPTAGSPGRGPAPRAAAPARPRPARRPLTTCSDQTTFFIASAGSTHGPPAALHPDEVATASSMRSSDAVRTAVSTASSQASDPGRTAAGTTSGPPIPPSKTCTPRTPTSWSQRRSRSMPSGSTFPSIQCHHARGRAVVGRIDEGEPDRVGLGLGPGLGPWRLVLLHRVPSFQSRLATDGATTYTRYWED